MVRACGVSFLNVLTELHRMIFNNISDRAGAASHVERTEIPSQICFCLTLHGETGGANGELVVETVV